MKSFIYTSIAFFTFGLMPMLSMAQTSIDNPFNVSIIKKITSADLAPFGFTLANGDEFGGSVTNLGDLDGDGNNELAVGAFNRAGTGTVIIISIDAAGNVLAVKEIANNSGGFTGVIPDDSSFGHSVSVTNDINKDGTLDLLVGAPDQEDENDPSSSPGRVHVLFLDPAGTVIQNRGLDNTGTNSAPLVDLDEFGHTVSTVTLPNGKAYIGIGIPGDDPNGESSGTVLVAKIKKNGKLGPTQIINGRAIGFTGKKATKSGDRFGDAGIAGLNDLDGNGTKDLVIGASASDLGNGPAEGAFWIHFIHENASVKAYKEISRTIQPVLANANSTTEPGDFFGHGTIQIGSYGNGIIIAAGAFGDDDGATNAGALWIVWVSNNGDVERVEKISNDNADFTGQLIAQDWFGFAAALISQTNNSAVLAVGAPNSLADNTAPGDLWILDVSF